MTVCGHTRYWLSLFMQICEVPAANRFSWIWPVFFLSRRFKFQEIAQISFSGMIIHFTQNTYKFKFYRINETRYSFSVSQSQSPSGFCESATTLPEFFLSRRFKFQEIAPISFSGTFTYFVNVLIRANNLNWFWYMRIKLPEAVWGAWEAAASKSFIQRTLYNRWLV